jgi:hypothetical protein
MTSYNDFEVSSDMGMLSVAALISGGLHKMTQPLGVVTSLTTIHRVVTFCSQ